MQWNNGYLTLGRAAGAPVRVHWTLPLGALFFSRFTWSPGFWLGFFLLILAHELGHALLVRRAGGRVTEIIVHGIGGECRHTGGVSELDQAVIAWGGVLAQAVLLVVALVVRWTVGVTSPFMAQLQSVWVDSNLTLMAINLLPIGPLDGATAWKLPGLLRDRWRRRSQRARLRVVPGSKQSDPAHRWLGSDAKHDEPLGPMPDALKNEIERLTREVNRAARKDKN